MEVWRYLESKQQFMEDRKCSRIIVVFEPTILVSYFYKIVSISCINRLTILMVLHLLRQQTVCIHIIYGEW